MPTRSISLLLSLLLAGCAVPRAVPDPVAAPAAQEAAAEAAEVREEGWRDEDLPPVELTGDLLLHFLAGDIAAQRGQPSLAARGWLDLARQTRDPRVARRAVELSLGSGQLAQALEAAQIWVTSAPESLLARQLLMSLLIRTNRLEEVELQIPDFLTSPQGELADFYMQLHLLWDRKADPAQVARLTGLLTAGKGDMPEAHFALAIMHAQRLRFGQALGELDAALKLRPWWEQAVMYKVQLLRQNQSGEAAIAFLREAIARNPMQQGYPLALARLFNEQGRNAEARQVYESVLARQPDQIEALVGAGLLALQARDFEAAHAMLSSALERGTASPDLLRYYLGQIDEERHRYREALEWYRQVGGDEQRRARLRIPRLLARLGEREAALQALGELSALSDIESLENIQIEGQVWRELKQPEKGREALTRGIAQFPDALNLYYDRSLMSDMLKDLAAGEADLRHVLSRQPDDVNALNALGYMLANHTGRLDEAQSLLDKAIAIEPDNPVIIDSVGWLRFRQGRLKEAVEWLGRAWRLLPDPEIAAHYAEALWNDGRKDEARKLLEEALRVTPDEAILLETRQRLGFQ